MLKYRAWIPLFLVVFGPQGFAAPSDPSREMNLSRKERKTLYSIISCARDLAQFDQTSGALLAENLLEAARQNADQEDRLIPIVEQCRERRTELKSGTMLPLPPRGAISEPVRLLVGRFVYAASPTASLNCYAYGPEVMVGLGLALEADTEAGWCKSADGRRWIVIGAGLGFGVGIGTQVSLHASDPEMTTGDFLKTESEAYAGYYAGVGVSADPDKDFSTSKEVAIGVGLGVFHTQRLSFAARFIPISSDRDSLIFSLLMDGDFEK